jgi:hypothetical protein
METLYTLSEKSLAEHTPDTLVIQIDNHNYMRIERGCFHRFAKLKIISLTHCKISRVDADVFDEKKDDLMTCSSKSSSLFSGKKKDATSAGLKPKLETIDLSHNLIDTLTDIKIINSKDFESLAHINISHNTLTKLDPSTFKGFKNLKLINLSHNRIETVVSFTFKNLESLESIDLSYNRIDRIGENALVNLPKLKTIDLSFNRVNDLNVFSFSSYKRSRAELIKKVEKLFKNVHNYVDRVNSVNEKAELVKPLDSVIFF